jgi:hypothetical protein
LAEQYNPKDDERNLLQWSCAKSATSAGDSSQTYPKTIFSSNGQHKGREDTNKYEQVEDVAMVVEKGQTAMSGACNDSHYIAVVTA